MKFVLHRNPENRNQKIPFPAMQMAELADAEQLISRQMQAVS